MGWRRLIIWTLVGLFSASFIGCSKGIKKVPPIDCSKVKPKKSKDGFYRARSGGGPLPPCALDRIGKEEIRFGEQTESDAVLDDVEAFFSVNREQLGFVPEEKGGEVAGNLVVFDVDRDSNEELAIDCTKFGSGAYSIPISVEHLRFESDAQFILAIETAGMFQRLVKHNYWRTANCILISMGGVPTRATRRFIRRMSEELDIPTYAFVDCDPYGICNIYRTLKVGSGNAAHINEAFCVPRAHFLGVTPDDIEEYGLPTHKMTEVDIKRIDDALKNDPFVQHYKKWQDALLKLKKMGYRAEQQAFAVHDLNHVIDTYLPEKLERANQFLP